MMCHSKDLQKVSFEQLRKLKRLGFDWIENVGYNKQGNSRHKFPANSRTQRTNKEEEQRL